MFIGWSGTIDVGMVEGHGNCLPLGGLTGHWRRIHGWSWFDAALNDAIGLH